MSIDTIIPDHVISRMREATDKAAKGVRVPEAMREACENMDRISDEVRRRHGVVEIGIAAIRELRDA